MESILIDKSKYYSIGGGNMKFKICIVADIPGWAFDGIAKKVQKELDWKYNIRIVYFNRRTEADRFYELIEENDDCDLLHFLNRRMLLLIKTDIFKKKMKKSGRSFSKYIASKKEKFSTAVYDYMDLNLEGISEHRSIFNEYTKKYYTSTKNLFAIYSSINMIKKPDAMIHDICDDKLFIPIDLQRFEYNTIKNRKIIIGWVGNSTHSGDDGIDLKGFCTILTPVINELQKEGYNIEGYYADRNDVWRLAEEMPEYYSKIDICVCVSVHEGTPRPVLEAMYCGVPIISTDVGIVSEAFGKKQQEFIIGSRKNGENDNQIKKCLKEKIIYLYNNRQLFKELSIENLSSIKEFDGGKTIQAFDCFFESCLKDIQKIT